MAKLIILSETTKQMTEKAVHASRAEGSKSSFNYEIVLIEALKLLRRQPGGGFCSKRLYSGWGWNVVSCRMACNPRQDGLRRLPKTRSSIARFKRVTTIYHSWKGYYLCDGSGLADKLTYPTGGHRSQFEP